MKVQAVGAATIVMMSASVAGAWSVSPVALEDLYLEADLVAYTSVISADSENVDGIYKLEVLEGLKGADARDRIYMDAAYVSSRLGLYSKQVVFLRRTASTIPGRLSEETVGSCQTSFRPGAPVYEVMYAGYSVLPVDSTSLVKEFSDKNHGLDSVDVCEAQVILPDRFTPILEQDSTKGCLRSWIPLREFLGHLRTLPTVSEATP